MGFEMSFKDVYSTTRFIYVFMIVLSSRYTQPRLNAHQ